MLAMIQPLVDASVNGYDSDEPTDTEAITVSSIDLLSPCANIETEIERSQGFFPSFFGITYFLPGN